MTAVASIPSSAGASQAQAGNPASAPAGLATQPEALPEGAAGAAAEFPALLDLFMQQEPGSSKPTDKNSEDKKAEDKKEDRKENALVSLPVAVPELPVLPAVRPALRAPASAAVPQSAIGTDSQTVTLADAPQPAAPECEPNGGITALREGKADKAATGKEPEARATAAPDVNPIVSTLAPLPVSNGAPDARQMVEDRAATGPEPPAGPLRSAGSEGSPESGEPRPAVLAFAVRLTPLEAPPKDAAGAPKAASLEAIEPVAPTGGPTDAGAASRELPRATATSPIPAVRVDPVASRETKTAEHPLQDAGAADPTIWAAPQNPETPAPRREAANPVAEPHRTPAPASEPATPVSPARDIRLQVTGGDQRVDVRLTERAGEVQVSVRTPDSQLAGALRDDLAALSARLEQSGFRAETWHPAGARIEHFGPSGDSSAAGSSGYRQSSGGGDRQQQHEPPPRRAPQPETNHGRDSASQEFSRLFSSLP